jgi:hypothetical protein
MRRVFGILLVLIGLFVFLDGVTVAAGIGWGTDVDLDTTGKIEIGVIFALLGLMLTYGGWELIRRSRSR